MSKLVHCKEVTEIRLSAVTPTLAVHIDFHSDEELALPFDALIRGLLSSLPDDGLTI